MSLDNTSIKNERSYDILKRNIDQTLSNVDESITWSNKRNCIIEEEKVNRKDSIQSLKVHTDTKWSFTNNDFEHITNTKSITHIVTQKRNLIPIIFHFASEEIIDIEKYKSNNMIQALNSIYSDDNLPKLCVHNFGTLSMKKSLQLEINTDEIAIIKSMYKNTQNNASFQSEIILSHRTNTNFEHNLSLSISDTLL
ncbi:unnamed protein product [Rotaria sp. Silwood2]|nr:unnamed protein product [Rotaria sp. Silwood2]